MPVYIRLVIHKLASSSNIIVHDVTFALPKHCRSTSRPLPTLHHIMSSDIITSGVLPPLIENSPSVMHLSLLCSTPQMAAALPLVHSTTGIRTTIFTDSSHI